MFLLVIAFVAFGILALTWLLYPLAMWLRGKGPAAVAPERAASRDQVAVVVATRDHPEVAVSRVRNLRSGDYPGDRLRIIVSVDAAAPFPMDDYRDRLAGLAEVAPGDGPGGKAGALNAGVRAAAGSDVIVFADVGQEFNREAIPLLVSALADPRRGAVTGRYAQASGDGLMAAWAGLEATIRAGQAASGSVVSATGAILAIRPSLWRDLPPGLICDDLFTGLSVVAQGYRVGFCPNAVALDRRPFTRDQQFARRVRTLTGLIQYCRIRPGALAPWRNRVWSHFLLHKVLRLLTPIPLVVGVLALVAFALQRAPLIVIATLGTLVLVGVGARILTPARFRRWRDEVAWLLRLQLIPALAIANGLRGRWAVWSVTPQSTSGDRSQARAGT